MLQGNQEPVFIPYPAIERHGLIGDRRTAALVSEDGVVDWLCLPDYDGSILFGALLDSSIGGHWKFGPKAKSSGHQHYLKNTAVLETQWQLPSGTLLLRDSLCAPNGARDRETPRALVRTLECPRGKVDCAFDLQPGCDFRQDRIRIRRQPYGFSVRAGESAYRIWSSIGPEHRGGHLSQTFELRAGQKAWAVLEFGISRKKWTEAAIRKSLEETIRYWHHWIGRIRYSGPRKNAIHRAAIMANLLTYGPQGSVVASPTTSVPEQIGGEWNADYRLSWVRDASLSLAILETLGDWQETEYYLQWLTRLEAAHGLPLQTLYGIRGERQTPQRDLKGVAGYRGSTPVRIGNHAYKQFQIGSLGFLADCLWIYLQESGTWRSEYWDLICRVASYITRNWHRPDNGIWELPKRQHYVSTRVMCWVALDRAIKIAGGVRPSFDTRSWEKTREQIHDEVMKKGWSPRLNSFRQRYEADSLDSAALLIPVMEFLPARHPRVLATINRIEQELSIDGFVYRFPPATTPLVSDWPMGQMEGAFLPCTFWMATAYAKAGEIARAEEIVARVEAISGDTGLLAEAIDPRTRSFLGNMPLLFSHMEYARAILAIDRARALRNTRIQQK